MKSRSVFFTLILVVLFCFSGFSQHMDLGKRLLAERKWVEAAAEFSRFGKDSPEYADSRYYLGIICTRKKEFEKAETYLKEAIALNGNNADYHVAFGSVLGEVAMNANLIKQGMLASKIKNEFEIAARLDPTNIQARWRLVDYYIMAPGFMGGDVEKGKAVADEILKINPAEGNLAWGTIWKSEKKNDLAEKCYQTAVTLAPDNFKYYYSLAQFYENIHHLEKAMEIFQQTAEKFPGIRDPNLQIGRLAATSGKMMEEGEKSLNEFIRLTPDKNDKSLANAYYYLGMIEKKRGNMEKAKKQIESALKLNPNHEPSRKLLKEL